MRIISGIFKGKKILQPKDQNKTFKRFNKRVDF